MRALAVVALAGCVTAIEVRDRAPAADTAAPFTLPAHDGTRFTLGPGDTLLVFYRGHW